MYECMYVSLCSQAVAAHANIGQGSLLLTLLTPSGFLVTAVCFQRQLHSASRRASAVSMCPVALLEELNDSPI